MKSEKLLPIKVCVKDIYIYLYELMIDIICDQRIESLATSRVQSIEEAHLENFSSGLVMLVQTSEINVECYKCCCIIVLQIYHQHFRSCFVIAGSVENLPFSLYLF